MLFEAKRTGLKQASTLVLLIASALIWPILANSSSTIVLSPLQAVWGIALLPALGFADGLIGLIHLAVLGKDFAKQTTLILQELFSQLRGPSIMGAGLVAAGEEFLFRGAIQPSLGIPIASALFTVMHCTPRRFWPLIPWTAAEGVMLGLICQNFGVSASMTAHCLHDIVGILVIRRLSSHLDGPRPLKHA